jgi:hypothetical protein
MIQYYRGTDMISDMETRRKKIVTITYCILCLVVSISLLTRDVIRCYNKYLSGEYQLKAEARIVNPEDIHFINGVRGQDYLCSAQLPNGAETVIYMYNIHDKKCDIHYEDGVRYIYAKDVRVEDLAYDSRDYKLLTGEKRYNLYEYMQRINKYTPRQLNYGYISGTLEKKIYQYVRVFSILLIFDSIYVIHKLISRKNNLIRFIMNGIMYVSSTFCLLISVFNFYFV